MHSVQKRSMEIKIPRKKAKVQANFIVNWWNNVDQWSVLMVASLIMFGVMLSFGSSVAATTRASISEPLYYVYRQAAFACIAVTLLFSLSLLSVDNARRMALFIYGGSLILLVWIMVFGHTAKGAQRWIRLGSFTLQPSEFIKPAAIVLVAWLLTRRIYDPNFRAEKFALLLIAVPIALFLMQPDVGQTILLSVTFFIVFFISGMSFKWGAILFASASVGGVALFAFFPHFVDRINRFRDPSKNDVFQIEQALNAIANGDLWGKGAGEGVIKYQLPDSHTDFIFAMATEEWGLLGALLLISLFAVLIVRGIHVASRNPDPFAQLAGIGLFTLFGLQASINLAVNLNLSPAKGMTLPFISYGGSSLIGTAITMGLALALSKNRPGASILRKVKG
ncbi:MAG: putative peptidoglycan glycosyltransferase FtsW [Pseudomonadota bacterium]